MLTRRLFLTSSLAASFSSAARRPNVLFISVDDMNDWVGCLGGYRGVATPHIDRLASRGALFTDAHCAAPVCNPSRTALLTGWAPHRSGVYDNEHWWRPALPDALTLPQHFRRDGYIAAGAGKVFHHVAGFNPPDQWDEFELQEFDDPWYRRTEWYPWVRKVPNPPGHPFNGLRDFPGEFDWGVLPKAEAEYGDQRAVDFGERFLARSHGRPFFLAIGLWHPHIPMFAPQAYFDLYPPHGVRLPASPEDDLADLPPMAQKLAAARREEGERILREGKWREAVRAYLACISFADAMVGRLLQALDSSRYARDTIIVFWSDNGWHLGEKRHWHKSTLWQRSTHVPLIFAGPGVAARGRARRQPVSLLDIYPTLAALCRLSPRRDLDGASLAPLLADPAAPRPRPAVCTFRPGNHAVITSRWRYIRYQDGGEELYDRVADPHEWRNLASQPGSAALKTQLARWAPPQSVAPVPERSAYDFDFNTHTWRRR